jgi:hypothetical protein
MSLEDAARAGVDAIGQAIQNLCDDDCPGLAAKIKEGVGELRKRYVAALVDEHGMYSNARFGRSMTWESHKIEYENRQLNLQRNIAKARAKGCAYDIDADTWATRPYPENPVRWMNGI